ncbi:immunoglobulin-like domain-containing protein [Carnobacterium maltaromaticum]|uniref:immunoglobulin-like domain-containing protein n=1 Tax=Carnobacterium maltaromaticum TaxID=2751 RepID=UPI00295E240F|nr:toxin Cry1Ac domain D-VI-related protein [Carnobacterium maltaromaticum]
MKYKKMLTSLTTATILLTSITGTGLTLFTEDVFAATSLELDEITKQATAQQAVNELFVNNVSSSNAIKGTVDQNTLNAAKALVNEVTDPTKKASLLAELDKAQGLRNADILFGNEVQAKLYDLYTDNGMNKIKDTTDQEALDALQLEISKVVNTSRQAYFQGVLDNVQALLNKKQAEADRQAAAEKAANELFVNNTPSSNEIKGTTDQKGIDGVQAVINTVTDAGKKASLQADLDKAQSLLNAKLADEKKKAEEATRQAIAEKAVNELFTDNSPSSNGIKGTTDQKAIDNAQALINAVSDSGKKANLQENLNKAKTLLNQQEGTDYLYTLKGLGDRVFSEMEISIQNMEATVSTFQGAPHSYFSDNYASILIEDSRGQVKYDKKYVGNVSNLAETEKTSLTNGDYITVTHKEVAGRLIIQNETTQTPLAKETTTIYMVTSKGLVAVTKEEKDKAYQDKARQEVNALFLGDNPSNNAIKGTTNQKAIDAVQAVINTVTDAGKKASLQADLDKAQGLRNADILFGNEVQAKLYDLYTDNGMNKIKDTTDQEALDALQLEINKVVNTSRQTYLQGVLDNAQALLNKKQAEADRQAAAEKAANELFVNNTPSSNEIKGTTDQKAIDGVQAVIDTVTDAGKKESLQKELDKAQALLDAKVTEEKKQAEELARQAAAEKAANELFTNDTPSSNEIKGTTDQKAIDGVQAVIDTVIDSGKKESLQKELDKAQALLDAKLADEKKKAEELARQAAAEKAANELFTNDTPSSNEIKGTTDQKAIDAVQAVIDTVTDAGKKESLQKELDKVQALLDAKVAEELARQVEAEKAANELFTNDMPSSNEIKGTTDQKAIDAVQLLINTMTDDAKKAILQAVVDQAKNLLAGKINNSLNLNEFQLKMDGNITGTISSTIKTIRVSINNVVYTGGTLKNDGTFTFYAKDKIKSSTDKVVVSAYNAAGELVVSKNLTISQNAIGKGTVTPVAYQVGVDSSLIGTYTGDVNTIRVYVDGTEYTGGTLIKADGSFKFYLKDKVKNVNQVVTIKGFDVNGNVLSTNTITLKAQTVGIGQILPAPFVLGTDYYVTGTYKGDVRKIRVFVDGTEFGGGTINSDGTFKFYGRDKIKSKTSEVKIIAYDMNDVATEEKIIPVVSPEPGEGEISPNPYNVITDNSIKGTFTGDVAQMKIVVDDVEYTGGTFNSDKTFSFYARGKVTSTIQNVKVRGYDVQGNLLSEKQLVVTTN